MDGESGLAKILYAENGLAERLLLLYQKKEEKDLEVMCQHYEELDNYPIQSQWCLSKFR